MRTGTIVAIAIAGVLVIGGVVWYNSGPDQARLDAERTEQAAVTAREEDRAREEEEQAASQEIAREQEAAREAEEAEARAVEEDEARIAEEIEARAADEAAAREDAASGPEDDAIVIGDEITEDTTVVQSEGSSPTLLDPDSTDTTVERVDDAQPADGDAQRDTATTTADTGTQETDARTAAADATGGSADGSAGPTDPEQVLSPENFDRDAVLALIEDSERLNDQQRDSLRELVEVAATTPDMVDTAIETIRRALNLPSLD